MIKDLKTIPMITELKDELQKYTGKNIHRCPLCEKKFEWDDCYYNPAENIYTCPFCLTDIDEKELLEVNVYDLFEEMFLAYKDRNQLFKEIKNERN